MKVGTKGLGTILSTHEEPDRCIEPSVPFRVDAQPFHERLEVGVKEGASRRQVPILVRQGHKRRLVVTACLQDLTRGPS